MSFQALMPDVYKEIKKLKIPILFREELYTGIMEEFPYKMVEELRGYDFERLTLAFLTDTFSTWVEYSGDNDNRINSIPILTKSHFSTKILSEAQSQVCHLFHHGQHSKYKFISHNYFFKQTGNLVLERQNETIEIDTICCKEGDDIAIYFEKFKIKFEHNPKHDIYRSGGNISPLSCYNERNKDKTKAQSLLDSAFLFGEHFYNFDLQNNTFVRFIKTTELIYHGHDLNDEGNNIPIEVKRKFNK